MATMRQDLDPTPMARYQQLYQHRQIALLVPGPQCGATCARLGVDDPDPAGPQRVTRTDDDPGQAPDMTITPVNDRMRARQDPKASMQPAVLTATTRECPAWGVVDCRTVLRWPGAVVSGAPVIGARLWMTGPEALVVPPSGTAHGPARGIVPPVLDPAAPPQLLAVLSAVWPMVAG